MLQSVMLGAFLIDRSVTHRALRMNFTSRQLLPVLALVVLWPFANTVQQSPQQNVLPLEKVTAPELRYRIIDHFGHLWFCDPDSYPIARPLREQEMALRAFPTIREEGETFRAIATHLGLKAENAVSNEQKVSIYREYKRLRWGIHLEGAAAKYNFRIAVREPEGGFRVEGVIDSDGHVTVLKKEPAFLTCPVCLAGDTLIDTPEGPVAVKNVEMGRLVWTMDTSHRRVAVPILRTIAVPVSGEYSMVHLVMKDGRELRASPGHPTADGHRIEDLARDATYDGSSVESAHFVAYGETDTYDLLPAGPTGLYWANGILLRSTLREPIRSQPRQEK